MKSIVRLLSISLLSLLAAGAPGPAAAQSAQDPPPPQSQSSGQSTSGQQPPQRGGERRPGLFGKVTALHAQSIEIATQSGDTVTVKISGSTQFRKERQEAKLSDFKVGDTVFVRGQENADHSWTAEMIGERPAGGFGGGPRSGGASNSSEGGGPGAGGAGGGRPFGVLGQDYVIGEVKAVDAPKLTILRPDNVTQTVELNEETSLRKGRDSITMADIQVGDHILVRGATAGGAFQPKSVMMIGPDQWKRMQEMLARGSAANAPKDNNQPQKPPEPPH
jgi:Domain of unknown function (DUF5666)